MTVRKCFLLRIVTQSYNWGGWSLRVVLTRWTATLCKASSNSSCAITFTFGSIPFGKAWTPLSLPDLWVKDIYCCLPPDKIWHKIFFIVEILGKWEVGHKPRLIPCWTVGHRFTGCNVSQVTLLDMYEPTYGLNSIIVLLLG